MHERRFSVRLSAEGGEVTKAQMREIGQAVKQAMSDIAAGAGTASTGLTGTTQAAQRNLAQMEAMAAKAAQAAGVMRNQLAPATALVARINQSTGVNPAIGQSTADYLRQGQAMDDLRARYNPLFAAVRNYKTAVAGVKRAHLEGAISADEMAAAISRERQASLASIAAIKGRSTAITGMAVASQRAGHRMQQMFYQVNDVGVSLAGGMNPFVVMAQQGTQIAQIYGFGNGGAGAAVRDIGAMARGLVTRLGPLGPLMAATGLAVAGMTHEINNSSDVAVSFGNTALAVWQTVRDGVMTILKPAIDFIAPIFSWVWDRAVSIVKTSLNAVINGSRIMVLGIRTAISAVPNIFNWAFATAGIFVNQRLQGIAQSVANLVNGTSQLFNETFGTELKTNRMEGFLAGFDRTISQLNESRSIAMEVMRDSATRFIEEAARIASSDPMGQFFDAVKANAVRNALKDLEDDAESAGGAARRAGEEAATGWLAAQQMMAEYAKAALDVGKNTGEAMVGGMRSAEGMLREFLKTGRANWREFVADMLLDMAMVQLRAKIFAPIGNWFSGLLGSLVASAKGNVLSAGNVVPYANGGVVSAPTFFPMTQGRTGLMGEAGPEAIMPLQRIGGELGVRALMPRPAASAGAGQVAAPRVEMMVRTDPGVLIEVARAEGVNVVRDYDQNVLERRVNEIGRKRDGRVG